MNARDRKAPAAIAERFAWLGQPAQLEDALAADLADALAADQDVLNRGGKMFTTTLNLGDGQVNVGYD